MSENGSGYNIIKVDNYKKSYNGYMYEHRVVAEQKLGRSLNSEEVVHHLNHKRNDNDVDNLIIFASDADHKRFHACGEYSENAYIDEYGVAHCPSYLDALQIDDVFKNYDKNSVYCIAYMRKDNSLSTRFPGIGNQISRDQLKYLIRNNSFEYIGNLYGVSSNAIRKICKSNNLPYQKYVINNISDSDWDKI